MARFDESPRADLGIAIAAGLIGAAGVVLASVAAHRVPDPALVTAANFLMLHATAVLALSAWSAQSRGAPGWWRVAARLILLGVALFSGAIAAEKVGGFRLFPMAAPIGGMTLILGWIMVSVAAVVDWRAAGQASATAPRPEAR
ncbi:MAG: DUF423 domain-containing protein [Hyphomicrobium sp.]|nr:DUF423 domain-containing protein [Hyphomicrobium sp.]